MTFGEKLKELRKDAKLTQVEMAEKLELNARTYASYERDERGVSTSMLLKICKALHISSDELVNTEIVNDSIDDKKSVPAEDGRNAKKKDLTPRQERIVELFDELTEPQQDNIIGRAEMLAEQNEKESAEEGAG